jgi:orotate phosphoribosyltransferase
MSLDARRRLIEIIRAESLSVGDFLLASGRRSSFYLDLRRTTLHPEGSVLTAQLILDWMSRSGLAPDCIGGPTLGADPIVGATVAIARQAGMDLPGFLVRKEAKGHGTGRTLEGQWRPGWRAVIVEDTCTTGGSLLQAIRHVEEAGLRVAAVTCLVDRGEGGREALRDYRYEPLFTLSDIGVASA